ncbi:hypothetical protein ENUP19_0311G0013 [Entamoeba nuttalli]
MDQNILCTYMNDLSKEIKDKDILSTIKSIKSCLLTTKPLSDNLQQLFQILLPQIIRLKLTTKLTTVLLPIIDPLFLSNQTMRLFLSSIFTSFLPQPIQSILNCCRIVFLTSKFQIENTYHCKAIHFIIDTHVVSSYYQTTPSQFYPLRLVRDYIATLIVESHSPSFMSPLLQSSPSISPVFAPSPSPAINSNLNINQIISFSSLNSTLSSSPHYSNTPSIQPSFLIQQKYPSRSHTSWNNLSISSTSIKNENKSLKQSIQQAVLLELLQCASTNWFNQSSFSKTDFKKEYILLEEKGGKGNIKYHEISMEMADSLLSSCLPNVLNNAIRHQLLRMFSTTCFVGGSISDLAVQILIQLIIRHGSHVKSECRTIINNYINETNNPNNSIVAIKSLLSLSSSGNAMYCIYTIFDRDSLGSSVFKSIVNCFLNGFKNDVIKKYCAQGIVQCIRSFAPSPPLEIHPSVLLSSAKMIEEAIEEKCPTQKPLVVGNYLRKDSSLDKNGIGYYLTRHEDALNGYFSILDLSRYDFYDALSISLNGFILPNDNKSTTEFIKTFAEIYHVATSYSIDTVKKLCMLLLQFSRDISDTPIISNFQKLKELSIKMNIKVPTTDLMKLYDQLEETPLFKENKQIPTEDQIDMFHRCFSLILSALQQIFINELDPFSSTRALLYFSSLCREKEKLNQLLSLVSNWPLQESISTNSQSSSLKLLLQFCYSYGNSFHEAWQYPIKLFVHLINIQTDRITSIPKHFRFNRYIPYKTFDLITTTSYQTIICPDDTLFLAVIHGTALSPSGLLSYIIQLLNVAFEMTNSQTPSISLLNMLLSVIHFNIYRIFYIYDSLSTSLFQILNSISLHPQPKVAQVALEILSSIYDLLIQREELEYFNITETYYEMLLITINDSPLLSVRQLVLSYVKKCSDWRRIFQILSTAAEDIEMVIVETGFEKLVEFEKYKDEYFDSYFPYYINTLSMFSICPNDKAANYAVEKLANIAENVKNLKVLNNDVINIWMPCIKALAKSMLNTNVEISTKVIQIVYEKLLTQPTLIDDIKMRALQIIMSSTLSIDETSKDWVAIIGTSIAFRSLETSKSYPLLLPDVINLITLLILTTNEALQKTGIFILNEIIPKLVSEPSLFIIHFTDLIEYFYDQITTSLLSITNITPSFTEPIQPSILSICSHCNKLLPACEMIQCALCELPICSTSCLKIHSQQPHNFIAHKIIRHMYVPKQNDLLKSFSALYEILSIINCNIEKCPTLLIPLLYKHIERYLSLRLLSTSSKEQIDSILKLFTTMCISLIIKTEQYSPFILKLFEFKNIDIIKILLYHLKNSNNPKLFITNQNIQLVLCELINIDDMEVRKDVKQLLAIL